MAEMTKHVQTTIRYDGPALADHEMDVTDLAPALLALAEIAKIANQKFNGDRATIRVLVNADMEQRCFQLDLSLVQSWMDHARLLIGEDNVTTVKQIAEVIGLAGPPAGGLFWLYKKIYGKKDEPVSGDQVSFTVDGETGTTVISIKGDGNHVVVSNQTAQLAQDPKVLSHIKTVLQPLQRPGYHDFSIRQNNKALVEIDRDEADSIRETAEPLPLEIDPESFTSTTDAQVEIVTAQYKGNAQWGLWWTGRTRLMKISDDYWLSQFQAGRVPDAMPGAWLDVSMEITSYRDKAHPPSFTVLRVKGVLPPTQSTDLFEN